jgi:hypothetical protein
MSNPYAKFMSLLPKNAVWVAEVTGTSDLTTDGIVDVLEVGSDQPVRVRAKADDTYSAGDFVFVVNGIIQSKVSNLQKTSGGDIIEAPVI